MKTSQSSKKFLPLLILVSLFASCNKDTDNNDFEVFADAYIVKKLMDNEVKAAVAFYAYANGSIASVTVTPPPEGGESFELVRIPESSYTFFKEPEAADFKTELPAAGIYQFEVKSKDGKIIQQTDLLEITGLEIPQIESTTYQPESFSLKVTWESVTGADGYVLKLLNEEGLTNYISFAIAPTVKEFVINSSSGNWNIEAYPGDNLMLQVQAFAYDSDASAELNIYNIGEISIAEKEITWGQ